MNLRCSVMCYWHIDYNKFHQGFSHIDEAMRTIGRIDNHISRGDNQSFIFYRHFAYPLHDHINFCVMGTMPVKTNTGIGFQRDEVYVVEAEVLTVGECAKHENLKHENFFVSRVCGIRRVPCVSK